MPSTKSDRHLPPALEPPYRSRSPDGRATPSGGLAAASKHGGPPRLLLVEDNPADADLVMDFLAAPGTDTAGIEVRRVDRVERALAALRAEPFDILLLDLSLPDAEQLDGLEALTAAAPELPIVVMSGLADDQVALAAVQAGAQDYLVKGQDDGRVLRRAIRYAMERQELLARERTARATAERASRARDEVLSIVSHDLRAPLSTITMCAHALREPDADGAQLADMIMQSAEWSLRIIRDLLDVSAIEAGRLAIHPEHMTVAAILESLASIYAPLAREKEIALTVATDPGSRWISADVDRLVQALGNLVGNAIKLTPRDGRVSVSVHDDGTSVRFRVTDTGPGIAPEHLANLFDRFWQAPGAHRSGAGLGLAIARGIAEGHGGRIEVESTPGEGATFTLILPSAPPPPR
jgi:signal transduction histidine kinase